MMDMVLAYVVNCPSRRSLFTIHLSLAVYVDHLSRETGTAMYSHLCGHGQQRGDAQGNSSRNRPTVQPERDLEHFYSYIYDLLTKYQNFDAC